MSFADQLLSQMRQESGMHISRSDSNNHLTIKNFENRVIGHMYENGSIKGTNQGGSGALNWLLPKK